MRTLLAVVVIIVLAFVAVFGIPGEKKATDTATTSPQDGKSARAILLSPTPDGDPRSLLASLTVEDKYRPGYDRDAFGTAWADVDDNGCDTRNDILSRDMTSIRKDKDQCTVKTGVLDDPYTGKKINFTRGKATSEAVQIDHIVALANAWKSGAADMSSATRLAIANDPLNLLAVDGPANQDKKAKDASEWLPENTSFDCTYVTRQIQVKAKYGLSVTKPEKAAMENTLAHCS